ncbi:MAG: nucleoside hydrolase [Planctomycetota bacterium]
MPAPLGRPVQLIFDTDIGNDCDDVMAMGVIHALQSRGDCELLAVTITKDHEIAAPFVDAINTFYGRGEIPVGVCQSGVTPHAGKFNQLANERNADGTQRYPHDLTQGDAKPAVQLLRETLASAEDDSIVIAQVGFSTNLADLLRSKPDAISDLGGAALVKRKVRLLSLMAGAFTQIVGDTGHLYDHKEYNVVKDLASARYLAQHWPTRAIWSGFEIGRNLRYPHESIERDFGYVTHHPIAEAYIAYNPPPHNRPTWDLTSVLHAVRPDREYFELSQRGNVLIVEQGLTEFKADASGNHQYLIIGEGCHDRITEALVQLTTQPPCTAK